MLSITVVDLIKFSEERGREGGREGGRQAGRQAGRGGTVSINFTRTELLIRNVCSIFVCFLLHCSLCIIHNQCESV